MAEEELGGHGHGHGHGHTGHTDWCLERLGGDPPGQRLQLLAGTEVTLGRGLGVTHQLVAKDSSLMISRNHCCFRLTAVGACTVTDNQSVNGVWVNGCRLVAHQPWALCEGDLVQLGVPVEQHKQAEFEYRLVRRAPGAGNTATSPPLPPRGRAKRKLGCRDTELGATQDNAGSSSSKVQRLSEDQPQSHTAPGPQRDTAPGPESERDTQRGLGTERDTARGPETERDTQRGPESERDTQRGLGTERDTERGPGTERDTQQSPESERDTQRGLGTERDTAPGPESERDTQRGLGTERDTAPGPESGRDTQRGLGTERDTQRGPGTERDTQRGLGTERDTARGPESERDTQRGLGTERDTERGPGSERDTARGPGTERDTERGPGSERDTARGPESERDTARGPESERDTARGPESERDTARGPESERDTARDPGPETDLGYRNTARGLGTAGGQGESGMGQSEQREYPGTERDPGNIDAVRGPGPERDRQHGDQDKNQGFGDREPARGVCDDSRLAEEQQPQAGGCGESAETRLSELLENELQCIICSQHFVQAVTLGCSHSFCGPCIGEWSRRRPECPMCRRPIRWQTRSLVLDGCVERLLARTGPPHPPAPALTPVPNGCSTERHTQQ